MGQQNELPVAGEQEGMILQGGSNLLENAIKNHKIITIIHDANLDVRPNSLLMTSLCSTGGVYGDFAVPLCGNVLHIDGVMPKDELKGLMQTSGFHKDQSRIHYFSIATFNQESEHSNQKKYFLTNATARKEVNKLIDDNQIDFVILHSWGTTNDYFLDGGDEKKVLEWIRNLKRKIVIEENVVEEKSVAAIIYCGKGAKGEKLLQDISDVSFTITQLVKGLDASIVVECDKYSAYENNVPKPFSFSMSHGNGKGWNITQTDVSPRIFDLIIELNELTSKTQAEIANDVGCNQSTVCRNIAKAKATGIIDGNGKRINHS